MAARKKIDPKPQVERKTEHSAKEKAIELAVSSIEKQFGKGAILKMDGNAVDMEIEHFSSGSPSIDIALGIGGYPQL